MSYVTRLQTPTLTGTVVEDFMPSNFLLLLEAISWQTYDFV